MRALCDCTRLAIRPLSTPPTHSPLVSDFDFQDGRVLNAFKYEWGFNSHVLYECSPGTCGCSGACRNRMTPLDGRFEHRVEIYKHQFKGFCAKSRDYIQRGDYVCDFVGEILEGEEDQMGRSRELINEYSMDLSIRTVGLSHSPLHPLAPHK